MNFMHSVTEQSLSIRFDRLLTLANHLEGGRLGHKYFNVLHINAAFGGKYQENGCGDSGDAIGECPIAFPAEWEFRKVSLHGLYTPILKGEKAAQHFIKSDRYITDAMSFFGITREAYTYLFCGWCEPVYGDTLRNNATPQQAARHLKAFCNRMSPITHKKHSYA